MSNAMIPAGGNILDILTPIPPPPGVQSNLKNPEDDGFVVIIVGSILVGIMMVFLIVRLYAKILVVRRASWDDLTCVIAASGSLAFFASILIGTIKGPLGKHLWDVPDAVLFNVGDFIIPITFFGVILVSPSLLFAKITILLLYLELFRPFKWMRVCVYIGITITSLYYIGWLVAQVYLAVPKGSEGWFVHLTGNQEVTLSLTSVPFAAGGLAIDVFIIVLPMKAVMALQVKLRQRLEVAVVFLTGLMACVASILSVYFRAVANTGEDLTYTTMSIVLSGLGEICAGVVVGCMPSLSKILRYHLPALKIMSSAISSRLGSARRALLRGEKKSGSTPFSSAGRTILRPESPTPSSHYEASIASRVRTPAPEMRFGAVSALSLHHEAEYSSRLDRCSRDEHSDSDLDLPIEGVSNYTRSSADSLRAQEEGRVVGISSPSSSAEKSGQGDIAAGSARSSPKRQTCQEAHDAECAWYEASGE